MMKFALALVSALLGSAAMAGETTVPNYAEELNLTLRAPGPDRLTVPEPFSATNCVATDDHLWVATGVFNSNDPANSVSTVRRYNAATLALTGTVQVTGWLQGIGRDRHGKLWVSDFYGGRVYRIDPATMTVDATISGLGGTGGLATGGDTVAVSLRSSGRVALIDALTATVRSTVTVGSTPFYPGWDGRYFRVPNFGSSSLSVIDPATDSVVATPSVAANPFVYFSLGGVGVVPTVTGGLVGIIDEATNAVIRTWSSDPGAAHHFAVAVRDEVWIAASGIYRIDVFDRNSGALRRTIPTGNDPAGICANRWDVFSIDYYPPHMIRRHAVDVIK